MVMTTVPQTDLLGPCSMRLLRDLQSPIRSFVLSALDLEEFCNSFDPHIPCASTVENLSVSLNDPGLERSNPSFC